MLEKGHAKQEQTSNLKTVTLTLWTVQDQTGGKENGLFVRNVWGLFPRLGLLVLWLARPALVDAAFNTFILPLLGIIFLPFMTLIYVIVYVPGVGLTGSGFIWVILALLLDIGHWGASYTQRDQIPGRSA
jgi:hypothetical protein